MYKQAILHKWLSINLSDEFGVKNIFQASLQFLNIHKRPNVNYWVNSPAHFGAYLSATRVSIACLNIAFKYLA
jgi:hypothetical protein